MRENSGFVVFDGGCSQWFCRGLAGASVAAIAGRVVVFWLDTMKSVSGVNLSAFLVPESDRFGRR
jgi:hypothetical protein